MAEGLSTADVIVIFLGHDPSNAVLTKGALTATFELLKQFRWRSPVTPVVPEPRPISTRAGSGII